jgi:murein DD-endopeptidase MepM/ murein hydrolase activator NlpD
MEWIKSLIRYIHWIVLAFLGLVVIICYLFVFPSSKELAENEPNIIEEEVIPYDEFGIPEGRYQVKSGVVGTRQTLSHILSGFNLSAFDIDVIARSLRDIFDPRHLRAGQPYHGYYLQNSNSGLQYFIYEISHLEYVKIDFSDELLMERLEREVVTRYGYAAGVIHSSLWNALSANNINPELAIRMSEVLAWEVDFYRIQKGDRFKVIYEENFVGDRSVGISRVDAIYFVHQGRDIHGFRFEQDTIHGFFNQEGESLRKVFLKAPLEFGRITSRYSHSRLHPILNQRRPHYGTDYAAPHGTPILAVGDGRVTQTAYNSGNGNYVRIRHNSVYETQYLHMSRFAAGIRPGVYVKQGQVIGYVGSTGLATGPHVCFRFWKNGQQVDHLREEFPSAEPLPEVYHDEFFRFRNRMMQALDYISFPDSQPV